MRLHQWLLFGVLAMTPLAPTQGAYAATIAGTASFSDTGPGGNGLNFFGVFNPSNAFNLNLTYGSPVTLTNFLTIIAVDTNTVGTATDTIKTNFSFTQPTVANGSVTGTGTDTSLFFVLDNGNIHWNGPAVVDFGNGLDLTIALSDGSFFGSVLGSVGVNATFSLTGTINNVAQTPLPTALPLFASVLAAMGLVGWWRRKRQLGVAGALG